MPDVRKATTADIELLATTLARAFADDPVMSFLFPERKHLERLRKFFHYELSHNYLRRDETWTTTEGVRGAAIWAPPNRWQQSRADVLRMVPALTTTLGRNTLRALKALNTIEAAHPPGEHYYLAVLGTDPAAQGKGVGAACLAPVLARCDNEGIGAYLESSKERNVPFYNRHGFEVTRELKLPDGGPPLWLMWREPRPPDA